MNRNRRNPELDRLTHLAQTTVKWAHIDLDLFLSLSKEERLERWQQFDFGAKWQLIALWLERTTGDWMPSDVEAKIAYYDAKAGVSANATPTDAAVEGALEQLADAASREARACREAGQLIDASHAQRSANAYVRALLAWREGIRPHRLPSGAYLLPSRTTGPEHRLTREGGSWRCSCQAGASAHWAQALIIGLEAAADVIESSDDMDEAFYRQSARRLGERLAHVRARYLTPGGGERREQTPDHGVRGRK